MLAEPTPIKGNDVPSTVITDMDKLEWHKSLRKFKLDDMCLEASELKIHEEKKKYLRDSRITNLYE